jgi:hypothetical protein
LLYAYAVAYRYAYANAYAERIPNTMRTER